MTEKSRPRVLICEDEADISRLMELSLVAEGIEPRVIGSLKGLEEELKRFGPGVLVLDIMLPGGNMDGMEKSRELKENGRFPDLRILICSAIARGTKTNEEEIQKVSLADDVLFKPFEPQEFRKRVRALLED